MSRRIGIAAGFFIELKDGYAINRGIEESRALPTVLFWLQSHQGHKDYEVVQEWVAQKEKQINEDLQERMTDVKRDYVNVIVDEVARKSKLTDPELISGIRTAVLKVYGLPPEPGTQI